jgi:predicted ATP-dependent protease
VRARDGLRVPADRMARHRVLVHLVHIAEEREGPSAGVAFVVGIVSAASGRPVKPALAFTGEVSLHGKVTSVAGVAEKVKDRARLRPQDGDHPRATTRPTSRRWPTRCSRKVEVVPVETIEEVLGVALMDADPPRSPRRPTSAGHPDERVTPRSPSSFRRGARPIPLWQEVFFRPRPRGGLDAFSRPTPENLA